MNSKNMRENLRLLHVSDEQQNQSLTCGIFRPPIKIVRVINAQKQRYNISITGGI